MATTRMVFNLVADDSASIAFDKLARNVELSNAAIAKHNLAAGESTKALDANSKAADKNESSLARLSGTLKSTSSGFSALGAGIALLPAAAATVGLLGGAAIGLSGAFVASGLAAGAFGQVAIPVLKDAHTAATAVETAQNNYNVAIANGVNPAKAYKTEQIAIGKAYAEMSPQQIALSQQLGRMASAWQDVKAAQTPVVAGALQPWLQAVSPMIAALAPIIAKVAPVIHDLGVKMDGVVTSPAFKTFVNFIAGTGSAGLKAAGGTIIDLINAFIIILPKFTPLFNSANDAIAKIGPAVLKWASSQKTADGIKSFMQWFHDNGAVLKGLLENIGKALVTLAPGLAAGGVMELRLISDFFGLIAKLPKGLATPIAEVGGALLLLNKAGVFSGGVAIVNTIGKIVTGTKEWTAAQALLDLALSPIGLVVLAIAALGIAFYVAWQKSAGFRDFIKGLGAIVLGMGSVVVQGLKIVVDAVLGFFGGIIHGAATAFGWIPGIGPKLKEAATAFDGFKNGVDGAFSTMIGTMNGWSNQLTTQKATVASVSASVVADFTRQGNSAKSAKTDLDNYTNTVRFNGVTSTAAQQARFQLIADLVNAGVKSSTAMTDVTAYSNAIATNGLYSTQAAAARAKLISDILAASNNAVQGKKDTDALTAAVQQHGITSTAYQGARARLIADLVASGVQSSTAGKLVDGLGNSVKNLPGQKNVNISVSGSGTWSIAQGSLQQKLVGYAAGGRIPGYGGGDKHLALLEGGEAVVPKELTPQLSGWLKSMGVPGFASGGLVGEPMWVAKSYDATVSFGINAITKSLTDAINSAVTAAKAAAAAAAAAKAAASAGGGTQVGNVGSGVERWRGTVLQALAMLGMSPTFANQVLYQMQTESGGDPNAINRWDSNAAAGDPSRGLMQTIGSTFAAYHVAGTSSNIYDPLANVAAALNYARSVYGPNLGLLGSGHGYARGSWDVPVTGPANVHRGEMILPAELAKAVRGAVGAGSGPQPDRIERLLIELIRTTAAVPAATGAHVGGAISGAAGAAGFRSRYPVGGS